MTGLEAIRRRNYHVSLAGKIGAENIRQFRFVLCYQHTIHQYYLLCVFFSTCPWGITASAGGGSMEQAR